MKKKKIVLDAAVFDLGGLYPETRVSISDLLREGTKDEVRDTLNYIGMLLSNGQPLPDKCAEWLGKALYKISKGEDANKALGLKRKRRIPVQQVKNLRYLVSDLRKQGLTAEDALDMVSRYDHESGELKDANRIDALKKLLKRNPE